MKNLIWLASYPKSGNTWLRILLHSILSEEGKLIDINKIKSTSHGFIKRYAFDDFLELDSTELTLEETNYYKRAYFTNFSQESGQDTFIKTHDANIKLSNGQYLIPEEATKLAIYLVRNPLDIVGSFANHLGIDFGKTISVMQNQKFTFFRSKRGLTSNVDQFVSDWSSHVQSWINSKEFPVVIVKYEELISSPYESMLKILKAMGRSDVDPWVLKSAIKNNSFQNLVKREHEQGFKEKGRMSPVFFRKGKSGSWKEELTEDQVSKVCKAHKETMLKFNYLPLA